MPKLAVYFAMSLLTAFVVKEYLCDIVADNIDLWSNELLTRGYLPDAVVRFGIQLSLKQKLKKLNSNIAVDAYVNSFVQHLKQNTLTAEATTQANEQHYEVNASFYTQILGFYNKYSCTIYLTDTERQQQLYTNPPSVAFDVDALDQSEVDMFNVYINEFEAQQFDALFDRIISIEMFEHMKNYQTLLHNLKNIMKCDGKLFVHMFVHKDKPYHFEKGWMAQYFFTGGTMPSHGMLSKFDNDFTSMDAWKVNGKHYSYTAESWLQKMDMNQDEIQIIIADIYGKEPHTVTKWVNLWRTFHMAVSELFNMLDGNEWFVGHYLLEPKC
eukprot:634390_1